MRKPDVLARLEQGQCFYCAAGHCVPGWEPGLPKPSRQYRMCIGTCSRGGRIWPCSCGCEQEQEWSPMRPYSNSGAFRLARTRIAN